MPSSSPNPSGAPLGQGVRLGPFRLVRQLGSGGFAPVWLAEEIYEGRKLRDVAIKLFFVPEQLAGSPDATAAWRDTILDEAQALCRVEHPNVVRFYSFQRDDALGVVGLVMEYVAGTSLDELSREAGRLPERAVLEAASAVAWALSAVHTAGLVHRDVKPANVVRGSGAYKLIDFGISGGNARSWVGRGLAAPTGPPPTVAVDGYSGTVLAEEPAGATMTLSVPAVAGGVRELGSVLAGTPGYIAPECAAGQSATPASDLYALGVLIFRLRTGRLPAELEQHSGEPAHWLLVPQRPAPPLEALVPDPTTATGLLSRLTATLVALDPQSRPRHADQVARELDRILAALDPELAPPGSKEGSQPPHRGSDRSARPPLEDRPARPLPEDRPARPSPGDRPARPSPGDRPVRPLPEDRPVRPTPDGRPPLLGRRAELDAIARAAQAAQEGRVRGIVVGGHQGIGRSRLLDAAVERTGWDLRHVVRLRCLPERRSPFHPLRRAAEELGESDLPELRALPAALERALSPALLPSADEVAHTVEAIEDALLRASAREPLLLLVDDLQWADAATLELIKLLLRRAAAEGQGRLLVVAAARSEPSRPAPLRALLGEVRARVCPGVTYLGLAPLDPEAAAELAQAVGRGLHPEGTQGGAAALVAPLAPLAPALERAVVATSGGVPFYIVHALMAWHEGGALALRDGTLCAADDRALRGEVPGVADLLEARVASFAADSAAERSALRTLAAVALCGGGLGVDVLLRVVGDDERAEAALEALGGAGVLTAAGDAQEYSFPQEMLRQAALHLTQRRPWFQRLHRALLDALAEGAQGRVDAGLLGAGYERLGAVAEARRWLGRAMAEAAAAGLFEEAAAFADRLAALAADPEARAGLEIDAVRALIQGRKLEEASRRLARLPEHAVVARGGPLDVRRRIHRLEVARGLSEAGADDPGLLADADALGEAALRCEARMALAGVAAGDRAMELAGEAVELAAGAGPAAELAARVLRCELNYAQNRRDHELLERDLQRALAIAAPLASAWHRVHIGGDLAVLEAELGRTGVAIDRLRRLVAEAEQQGMRGQLRLLLQNLSAFLMREGRAAEAAEVARRTAELAAQDGDPALRAAALSLLSAALTRAGRPAAALESADQAEQLQRARGDRYHALTLLRRAEIHWELERVGDALEDAVEARRVAEEHGDDSIAAGARLWAALRRAQLGRLEAERRRLVGEVRASSPRVIGLLRGLLPEMAAWLDEG
ncbi:Protein kinase [Sorangium cellulosum So ce56]|uniref:non-specific serine/threonine protein kinase n=1 Tax=Sorangium cellulosum (strain So ce56) TaxID=448385 RepID=A9FDB2_SORC5|nr:AAA family ATPase [Sorangium cellulosum]CAN91745.1 Protein kinase [Sorangium cellulosum So ce56]